MPETVIVQGWESLNVNGWGCEMALEVSTDGEGFIVLTQIFRLADRGTAEIMAQVLRMEAEEHKHAEWKAWDPALVAIKNREYHG